MLMQHQNYKSEEKKEERLAWFEGVLYEKKGWVSNTHDNVTLFVEHCKQLNCDQSVKQTQLKLWNRIVVYDWCYETI